MNNEEILSCLTAMAEPRYAAFSAALTPGCAPMLGVRTPKLKELAKRIANEDAAAFLAQPPAVRYQEQRMLWGLSVAYSPFSNEQARRDALLAALPYLDNWALTDSVAAALPVKRDEGAWWAFLMDELYNACRQTGLDWEEGLAAMPPYRLRFVLVMLLDHFSKPPYLEDCLRLYEGIFHENYYVRMAVAWGVSECYVRAPERCEAFLKNNRMPDWTQNKAISKIRDSRRVPEADKGRLLGYRR